jgi:hypothetical protein
MLSAPPLMLFFTSRTISGRAPQPWQRRRASVSATVSPGRLAAMSATGKRRNRQAGVGPPEIAGLSLPSVNAGETQLALPLRALRPHEAELARGLVKKFKGSRHR